jgi:DegV family protein with EDD domain
MSIAIVTDSTADIPDEQAQQLQIHIIPNILVIDGQSMKDGIDISREAFYERLPEMKIPPTTATASSGDYQRLYETLFSKGASNIISIHAAYQLSGILNAASTAAQAFGDRVKVLDSGQVSLGTGFQVLAAAEASMRDASLEAILELIKDVSHRVRLVAMLDTLEYVRRSGRVSWLRAQMGGLLQVKPFFEVKAGEIINLGETRTHSKGVERMMSILRGLGPLERLAVMHSNAEEEARRFLRELNPELHVEPLVVNVTTVIGTHVGPNGLGFAAVIQ